MRVLVTGGAGFIGSHLVERLLARGDRVVVLDDLSAGSLENLSATAAHPSLEVVPGSASDSAVLKPLVERCDAVVHLAATVGVRRVMDQTCATLENNVSATRAVLNAAVSGSLRVVIASSSEVYGLSTQVPFREDAPVYLGPTHSPRWAYACGKAMDEWLGLALFRERGLPLTVARLFNTVGPRQNGEYGMVLPRFVTQALAGEPLCVYGTGGQTRSFAHVRDTAAALEQLLDSSEAIGEVVNVGSHQELSILELARRVIALSGSASRVMRVPYAEVFGDAFEDPPRRVPDLRKLERLTGFIPRTPVDQIVTDVIADQRARAGAKTRPRAVG